jgi:hypothetical protein
MATPNTPIYIPKSSQEGIIQFSKSCAGMMNQNWNMREQMRKVDLNYIRENDWTQDTKRAQIGNKYGDSNRIRNITVPVVMPQVENAVAYQSAVFLSGLPLFESVASPLYEDEAVQMNTILEDQSIRGGWVREFQLFLRDGFKYNISAIEIYWDSIVTAVLETDLNFSAKNAKPKNVIWEGNCIKRCDPYNTIMDTRVLPVEIPEKGEFAGYTKLYSRVALKDFINKLPSKIIENIIPAFESGVVGTGNGSTPGTYYTPFINPEAILNKNTLGTTDWMAWAGITNNNNQIQYRNMYQLTTLYGRIIPSDFGLKIPSANTPQVWKFLIVNNQHLIYAERQTNAHNLIPMLFGQPLEDGLGYQSKSLASTAEPFQAVSSALLNQSLAASRKAIYDRAVYDPSKIREADINNPNAASKIPVKPAAYGKNIRDAVEFIPFRDDQSAVIFQKMGQLATMADEATGHNRAQRGLFTKGNRTKEEYQDIMQNASGRDQLCSMLLEAQVFTPLKNILKINILQYQGGTTLYNSAQQKPVDIDPVALRTAVIQFKMSDGLTPTQKQISGDVLQTALQSIASSPTIGAGYNIAPLFSYLLKSEGADLKPFEKSQQQMAYEQAIQSWQQTASQVAELAKAATMKIEGVTIESLQAMIKSLVPPQPQPAQFGYQPGTNQGMEAQQAQPQPTIMQQVAATLQPQSQQP